MNEEIKTAPESSALAEQKENSVAVKKRPSTVIRLIGGVDRPLLMIVIALMCIGSVMVFSASYAFAETQYGDSYYFARKQILWVALGIVVLAVFARFFSENLLKRVAWWGYGVSLALNYLVPLIGITSGGATRWINILGVRFQPSEVLKFFLVIVCARYISEHHAQMKGFRKGILPFLLIGLPAAAATMLQSHLSATIIIVLIVYSMMWLGGIKARYLGIAGGIGIVGATGFLTIGRGLLAKLVPHAFTRIEIWRDPFSYMSYESGGKGWQPAQSLYAISSGGFWGLGLGQSNQKHGYLPEPQNDYIFAILCEELGFFGAMIVVGLFVAFAYRGYIISKNAPTRFSSLAVMGIITAIVIQVILNIAVVTNTLPSTGISLPFFSYGGTSLMMLLGEVGIVLAISRCSYIEK